MATTGEANLGKALMRSSNFTDAEDLLICEAWSNTTTDAATGNNQKNTTFWGKAHAYWLKYKLEDYPTRSPDALMQRFSRIKTAVSKFCGYMSKVQSLSGHDPIDKLQRAKQMYSELESKGVLTKNGAPKKVEFIFQHCWNVLKYDQKWLESINEKPKGSEVPHSDEPEGSETQRDTNVDEETPRPDGEERPVGKKLANEGRTKRKRKFVYDSTPLLERIDQSRVMTEKVCSGNEVLFVEHDKKLDKLLEMKREKIELEKKKYEMDEKKFEMDEKRIDTNLMKVDISSFTDPIQIQYFEMMRKNVMDKYLSKE